MSPPSIFYLSISCDAKISTAAFKRVVERHSLFVVSNKGRKAGKHYAPSQVLPKISEALLDNGAIPVHGVILSDFRTNRPSTLFVTGLEPYWASAIPDLASIGVRIYILGIESLSPKPPELVVDSFNTYYDNIFTKLYSQAQKGSDVLDLLEIHSSLSEQFAVANIGLTARHQGLISDIRRTVNESLERVRHAEASWSISDIQSRMTPEPDEEETPIPPIAPDDF